MCLQVFEPQHQQQLERVQVGSSQDAVRTSSGRAGSMELSRMEGAAGSRPNGRGPASGRSLELARSAGSMQRAGSAVPSSKRGSVSFKAIKEEKPALQEQVSLSSSLLCTQLGLKPPIYGCLDTHTGQLKCSQAPCQVP